MKRCPICSVAYSDETEFCLQDGTPLAFDAPPQNDFRQTDPNQPAPTVWSGSINPPRNYQVRNQPNYQPQASPDYQYSNRFPPPQNPPPANFAPVFGSAPAAAAAPKQYTLGQRFIAIAIFTIVMSLIGVGILFAFNHFLKNQNSVSSSSYKPGDDSKSSSDSYNSPAAKPNSSISGNTQSPGSESSSTSSRKPTLPPDRNGFARDKSADLNLSGYPNGLSGLIANYKTSSDSIVIEVVSYASTDAARLGFYDHLKASGGDTLEKGTSDGTPYAYFKNNINGAAYYHLCAQSGNQINDYFAKSMESVKAFLR